MSVFRRLITAFIVMIAVAVQVVVFAPLNWWGATPDLTLVVVAAFAMRFTPANGAIIGFAAGLLLDAAPPANGLLGASAFTLAIVGFLAGTFRQDLMRSVFGPLLYIGAAAAVAVLIRAGFGGLLGEATVTLAATPVQALTGALYALVLATAVVPASRALLRLLMPAPTEVLRR